VEPGRSHQKLKSGNPLQKALESGNASMYTAKMSNTLA